MAGCATVFEPEVNAEDEGLRGFMRMVLQSRKHMETFCERPFIVDFLTRRFTYDLPSLVGTKNLASNGELLDLAHGAAHGAAHEMAHEAAHEAAHGVQDNNFVTPDTWFWLTGKFWTVFCRLASCFRG